MTASNSLRRVVWFSCGAASAVTAKLAVEKYGDACVVVNCDTTKDEHPDNVRFRDDVERWIGRKIVRLTSDKFASVEDVWEARRFMSGPHGAPCTIELKKVPRFKFQSADDVHLWGFTYDRRDIKRAKRFSKANFDIRNAYPLIDEKITKRDCLRRIDEAAIGIPEMYLLGFENNNCLGCVKATSPSYWNRIRRNFPEAFAKRAKQSRRLGARLVRVKNKRIFLDELDPNAKGREIPISCGPDCQPGLFAAPRPSVENDGQRKGGGR